MNFIFAGNYYLQIYAYTDIPIYEDMPIAQSQVFYIGRSRSGNHLILVIERSIIIGMCRV